MLRVCKENSPDAETLGNDWGESATTDLLKLSPGQPPVLPFP